VADYELPLGLHPGATPANPGVQKGLILRGFLEAILRWRRGRPTNDCPDAFVGDRQGIRKVSSFLTEDVNLSVAVRRCSARTASYLGTELGTGCPTRQRGGPS
jgi:hypothetical protein